MIIKNIEEFKKDCLKRRCNRTTFYNEKTCKTESKQDSCYIKYMKQFEKNEQKKIDNYLKEKEKYIDNEGGFIPVVDEKWEELKRYVWLRDTGYEYSGSSSNRKDWMNLCVIWRFILSDAEKKYILKNHYKDLWLNETLDIIHIESRARKPEDKYNPDNVILGGRLWHTLLDTYKDIVTQQDITNDERKTWLSIFKNYIKEINKY